MSGYSNLHKDGWGKFEGSKNRASMQSQLDASIIKTIKKMTVSKGDAILDIGCGRGTLTHDISTIFPDSHIYGVDKLFPFTNQEYGSNIEYTSGDIELGLPYNDSTFKFCISKFVVMYLNNLGYHFDEIARVLKDGQEYLMIILNPEYLIKKQKIVHGNDVQYGDRVTHNLIAAGLQVDMLLHSPEDYQTAISSAGLNIVSSEPFYIENPKFDFAKDTNFADMLRIRQD